MAITKPKPKQDESEATDAFIAGAPDAGDKASLSPVKAKKQTRRQVTLTIPETLLERVDEMVAVTGQSRAAIINMAIYRLVEHGFQLDGVSRKD